MTRDEALKLRAIVEQASASLDDQTASAGVQLFPRMKYDGALIKSGARINWNGKLKRASVDVWDTEENNPDNAPTIWEDIAYINGIRVIHETITATLAFKLDELGWWEDKVYRSKRDGNTFNPSVTPEWWEVVE